jgi:hypothetical protein
VIFREEDAHMRLRCLKWQGYIIILLLLHLRRRAAIFIQFRIATQKEKQHEWLEE